MSDEYSNLDLMPGEAASGKTEWEDALIKHGIIEAQKVQHTDDDLLTALAEAKQQIDPLESKNLDELDELEDEMEDRVLEQYRARRLEEMRAVARRELYGTYEQISEPDFVAQVSKAPKDTWVVCHLFTYSKPECQALHKYLGELAAKFRAVKFVKIVAQECIKNYPDSATPTVLIYKNGDVARNIVGTSELGGSKMSVATIEWVLGQLGIVETNIKENPALQTRLNVKGKSNRGRAFDSDDSDEDSD